MFRRPMAFALSLIVALKLTSAALAQDQADLAKAAQNPVAAMISLPFQNNTLFGVGPDDDTTSRIIGLSDDVVGRSLRVWPDRQWVKPINNAAEPGPEKSLDLAWRNKAAGFTEIESRAWFFTNYYSISPGMVSLTPGRGAAYEVAFNDPDGEPLSGDASYKLTLPADIPAEAVLVAGALRGRERLRAGHRGAALPLARVARQPPAERRRHDPPLHPPRGAGGAGGELAAHGAWPRLLYHPPALRLGRESHRLQLEARRFRTVGLKRARPEARRRARVVGIGQRVGFQDVPRSGGRPGPEALTGLRRSGSGR